MIPKRFSGLWHNPDFMKLWTGQTISQFGSRITRDGLPLAAVLTLAATPAQMGGLIAVGALPVLLVGLFAGVWVDRLRRRPIMIIADVGRALLLGTIPVAAFLGVLTIWQLYIVAALTGILTVFFDVADQSFLPTVVQREHVMEGNSKLGASDAVAEVGGPALAGVLIQLLTAPIAMAFDALSFLASALCINLIRTVEPPPKPAEQRQKVWQEIGEGLRLVLGHPLLRPLAAGSAMRSFFGSFFAALYSLYAVRELGVPPAILGLLIGLGGIGGLAGALLVGPIMRRFGPGKTLIWSLALGTGLQLFVPLAGGPLILVALFFGTAQLLGDIGGTVYAISEVSLRQSVIPDRLLGRANASMHFLVGAVSPIGPLIAGALGEIIGLQLTLLISVLGMLSSTLWLIFSPVRTLREQQLLPDEDAAPASVQ